MIVSRKILHIALLTMLLFTKGEVVEKACASEIFPISAYDTTRTIRDSIWIDSAETAIKDSMFIQEKVFDEDTIAAMLPDSATVREIIQETDKNIAKKDATAFKPDPQRAYLIAALFPGFGQIYNRQYWKLPLVYAGVVGFMYAITWNNKNYQDYRQAYLDLSKDKQNDPNATNPDSWSQSWQDFVPYNYDPASYFLNSGFQDNLEYGNDFYRRNRDLSIILGVVFYLICVADAYVDAQMFDFDVSPDLSFKIAPEVYVPVTLYHSYSVGLNLRMTF